jgi:hypothetical protein
MINSHKHYGTVVVCARVQACPPIGGGRLGKSVASDEVARNGGGIASLKIQSTHSVPVSGSTIIFFGAGLLGLALWQGSRCSIAKP